MKRNILLLIPLMLGLASCWNPFVPKDSKSDDNPESPSEQIPEIVVDNIPNLETVNKVKAILSKQDLSPFFSKTLKGTYSQEYDVLEISNDEDTKTSNYFNYSGGGMFGYYYDLTSDQYNSVVDEKGNIATFDAIAVGKGYYGIYQLSRTMSFERGGTLESKVNNLDIFQTMTFKTTDEDVWLYNTLDVTEEGAFNGDLTQRFNSTINKELLFGSVSTRAFREILSKVDLFDTPGNIEHLDKLYYSLCRELVSQSNKDISNLLLANQVSIQETDENTELSFVFNTENIEEEEADYIFPGEIKGTLFFDKTTYEFKNFNYEMGYKVETYDEETGTTRYIITKFTCSGESHHGLPYDTWEPIEPTVYEDVAEFLKDVNEQVVPPTLIL